MKPMPLAKNDYSVRVLANHSAQIGDLSGNLEVSVFKNSTPEQTTEGTVGLSYLAAFKERPSLLKGQFLLGDHPLHYPV